MKKNDRDRHVPLLTKTIRIMKVTSLCNLLAVCSISASSYAQSLKFSIHKQNSSISEVFKEIEKKSDFTFFFNDNQINVKQKVNVSANNASIEDVLAQVLQNTGYNYQIIDKQILIKVSENDVMVVPAVAQSDKKITGTVLDATGMPVIGANVMVKGTTNGTITDMDGKFSLDVEEGATLVVSYIGFANQEIKVGKQTNLSIAMKEDAEALDELVVVGYGTMKKKDLTGSVSVAKGDDLIKSQSFSPLENLKGKVSGVNIFSNTGQPGGASKVIIRGTGTINSSANPLYVVDGVVMENFKYLNPNDIESVQVLKDASSTAIYGARGANGVVLVTTKRGLHNDGIVVNYDGSVSVGTMARYMDVLDANEFMEAYKLGLENSNRWYGTNYSTNLSDYFTDPNLFTSDGRPLYNTDWQKESTRNTVSHNHQLSVQHGGEKSSSGIFLNYTDQEGLMLNNYMKRMNVKFVYDVHPIKWLSTEFNLSVNHTWANEIDDMGAGSALPRRTMIEMLPFMPVKFPDGTWSNPTMIKDARGFEVYPNPVHQLTTVESRQYRTQIFGNAAFIFHILPGLDLRTQMGVDAYQYKSKNYAPKDLMNFSYPDGSASIGHDESLYWQEETYLTYQNTFDLHRINVMTGMSWQERNYWNSGGSTGGFSDDLFGSDNLGAGTKPNPPYSGTNKWSMNSYFLRAAYSYNDKYMATLTGRVDGSSRFGSNNKYAFFPSMGLGWLMSNEEFMEDVSSISLLKLHTSYGVTGNSEIGIYQSLATMSSGTTLIGGERVPSSSISRLANPDLEWEKSKQFDVGFNLNFFADRLNFDISYYNKKTVDLLLYRPVPYTTGFGSVLDNIGSVRNQGLEFMMNTINIKKCNFLWSSSLNFSYNKNKIIKLGENDEDILPGPDFIGQPQTILRVGESVSSFYGYKRLGIWGEDEADEAKKHGAHVGEAKRSDEREIIGCGLPEVMGSFINTVTWNNFDFTLDLQFSIGGDVMQEFLCTAEDRFGLTNGLSTILHGSWNPNNPNSYVQATRLAPMSGSSLETDSHWVCNGSYLRGNLIQLGYTFDQSMLNKLHMKGLRLYFNVNNAFVICSKDFKGYDPEASSYGDNKWGQNIFFYQYPKARTYTLGLNLTF